MSNLLYYYGRLFFNKKITADTVVSTVIFILSEGKGYGLVLA